jgi:hypothetical protein
VRVRTKRVLHVLQGLDVSKATGCDGIPAKLLRELAHVLCKPLKQIFSLSLRAGYFPSSWKIADVVAIHKKKSKSEPGNYRPISLLAIMSKVLETIVALPLCEFLAERLSPHQFGFRKAHTSLDLLAGMAQRWANALKEGKDVRAIALDISKAFDRVWHAGLLWKLERKGISGVLLAWFRSYLVGRKLRVLLGSAASKYFPITAGVPQGSVLGPVLFLVMIDDLFDAVENELDVFADDSTLWSVVDSPAARVSVAESLNKDLAAIEQWSKSWLVTYNHTKTELVTFSRKRDVLAFQKNGLNKDGHVLALPALNPHPSLSFCSTVLPESTSFKIVGLTFTSKLCWSKHINNVAVNARRAIGLVKRLTRYLNPAALSTIYKSHVRSRMEYLCPIWGGAAAADLEKLNVIQRRVTRLIQVKETDAVKAAARADCKRIPSDLDLLAHRRGVSGLCFIHRLVNNTAPVAVRGLTPTLAPPPTRSTRHSTTHPPYLVLNTIRRTDADFWSNSCINICSRAYNALSRDCQTETDLRAFKVMANDTTLPPPFTVTNIL